MKRISITAVALLVVAAGFAEARPVHSYFFGYNSNAHRYRTRWSIYAHGLISGDLYYSPYVATGHGGARLVYSDVRYSPYAFGHGQSGLVSDSGSSYGYGLAPAYYQVVHHVVPVQARSQFSGGPKSYRYGTATKTWKNRTETTEQRRARRQAVAKAREDRNAARAKDGKAIIAEYLKANKIDFKTTRTLSIEGKTISVDFLLNDGKTILKYWNPAEIPSKSQQQQRQRKLFESYVDSCEISLAKHVRAGGKVHQIVSSDRAEILAKLPQCPDLNGVERVYAAAQD